MLYKIKSALKMALKNFFESFVINNIKIITSSVDRDVMATATYCEFIVETGHIAYI